MTYKYKLNSNVNYWERNLDNNISFHCAIFHTWDSGCEYREGGHFSRVLKRHPI